MNKKSTLYSYKSIFSKYRFYFKDCFGHVIHIMYFFFQGPPHVRPLPNITAIAETNLYIDCHVVGYPIQTISWYKGATALPSNIRQTVHSNGTLSILNVEPGRDEGIYRCVASNRQGQSSSQDMTLAVRSKYGYKNYCVYI